MEFDTLPLEIHLEIFSYLSFCDVMRIRRVCRLWNRFINGEFKFKRLRFYQTYKPYITGNALSCDLIFKSPATLLDYPSTDSKFSRVRYLKAFLDPKASKLQDAFDFLNSFKYLEEIKLFCYLDALTADNAVEGVQKQFVLSLSRLKKANFHLHNSFEAQNVSVLLDLPNLLCIWIDSLAGITMDHPEKVRTLATGSLFKGRLDFSMFTSLTNIFTGRGDLWLISAGFLERLPSLKELHVSLHGDLPEDYRLPEPSLSKASPKIFFFGFEFSAKEIESEGAQWPNYIGFGYLNENPAEGSTQFIAQKLHRSMDNNPHVDNIDYNTIVGELNDSEMFGVMPQKVSKKKVYNIHLLIRGTVIDENRLMKFIDKLKISFVSFERTSLSQRFFKKLAENCPFISGLTVTEPTMNILSGDLDFVLNFKNLKFLCFRDCPLSLNFVAGALKELKSLSTLSIYEPGNDSFALNVLDVYASLPEKMSFFEIHARSRYTGYEMLTEEAPSLMNSLHRRLDVNGAMCVKDLQILVHHLQWEEENALFWMRKYLYDQRHSICLSEEQMRLLNLRH